jgi:hypothetical protein
MLLRWRGRFSVILRWLAIRRSIHIDEAIDLIEAFGDRRVRQASRARKARVVPLRMVRR